MRTTSIALACVAAGAISLALADPSNTTQPQGTTTPRATEPAAQPQPAAPSAAQSAAASTRAPAATRTTAPAVDQEERHFIAMGYKPKVRNGVKVFCRYEDELGSRLARKERCGTLADLKAAEAATVEDMERRQATRN